MYRGRLWTMRQYAGFGTAEESNERYRYLLAQGRAGSPVAFDLPTQMGYDSDHPMAAGEVGKVGVAIDSIADMRRALRRHPARQGLHLDDHQRHRADPARALRRGGRGAGRARAPSSTGTMQNDVLKEYIARGTYIYPPEPSLRLITDIFASAPRARCRSGTHLHQRLPHARGRLRPPRRRSPSPWPTARLRGGRGRGRPRRRRLRPAALVLLQRRPQRLPRGGRQVPRRAAALGAHHAGALQAEGPRARCCASTPRPRGHAHQAQQPTTTWCGWRCRRWPPSWAAPSPAHQCARRGLALPTEQAARLALRTQQIIAFESGQTVDPLAGSYFIEKLTDSLELEASSLIQRIRWAAW
jgi:methylmalonyl-CoA mutase N-terminal domain/subunit